MVTYAQLTALKPEEFEQAADGWHKASSCGQAAQDQLEHQINAKFRGAHKALHKKGAQVQAGDAALHGHGASTALQRLKWLSQNFHYMQVQCGLVRTALNGLASEMRSAKNKLRNAVQDAEDAGMTVKSDGSVHYAKRPPLDGTDHARPGSSQEPFPHNPDEGRAQGFADRIGDALRDATEADNRYSTTLAKLVTKPTLSVTKADWTDATADRTAVTRSVGGYLRPVPRSKSPTENRAWWNKLTAEQRAEYISLHPASVGKLDGIPAEARDEANRIVLSEKKAEYETRLAAFGAAPQKYIQSGSGNYATVNPAWRTWHEKTNSLRESLYGMGRIERRIEETGTSGTDNKSPAAAKRRGIGLPPAYLLDFEAENKGRAIVANGNPDTADHTAVLIPGTNTSLSGMNGPMTATENLWQAATSMPGQPKVSAISWYGYDAPQGLHQAIMDGPADSGAPDLNRFMHGLETAQGGPDASHTTVIGHSYGSNVVGHASSSGDLRTDEIIVAGSPGMDVPYASDLDAPQRHVYALRADNDNALPELGRPFHGGHDGSRHGIGSDRAIIPSDAAFGAQRLQSHDGGHGGYWQADSKALDNQARVVTGRYGEIDPED